MSFNEYLSCCVTVNGNAFHAVRYNAPTEVRLVENTNSFVLPQPHFVEPERKSGINIDATNFDINSQRAGVQRIGHSCEITVAPLACKEFWVRMGLK